MSGSLNDSPAKVIAQLLVDLALGIVAEGNDIRDENSWPIYYSHQPDKPNNSICVYDTEGRIQGRTHFDGETQENYGIQVRVRGSNVGIARHRIGMITRALDGDVLRTSVVVGGSVYRVQAVTRVSSIMNLGFEFGSQRRLFTINAVADIRMYSDEDMGTGS